MERHVLDGARLFEVHPLFEQTARGRNFWTPDLLDRIAAAPSLTLVQGVPQDVGPLFVTAHEIDPKWHVRIQAAFQKHVDNAVSKTVNLPHDAGPDDVAEVYRMAYETGCKGITVFRDRSRVRQVLVRSLEPGKEVDTAPGACNRPEACARA
jgi:ribonucleoside-diphosphate reductase alpha chain